MKFTKLHEHEHMKRIGVILSSSCALLILTIAINAVEILGTVPEGSSGTIMNTAERFLGQVTSRPAAPKKSDVQATRIRVANNLAALSDKEILIWQDIHLEHEVTRADESKELYPASWFIKDSEALPRELVACRNKSQCRITPERGGKMLEITAETDDKKAVQYLFVEGGTYAKVPVPTFSDSIPSWAQESVDVVTRSGYMNGYDNGQFGAADPVTGAQFATMVYRILLDNKLMKDPEACLGSAPAIPEEHFAYKPFCLLLSRAWNVAWANSPNEPLSRGNVAKIIADVFEDLVDEKYGLAHFSYKNHRGQIFSDIPTDHDVYSETAMVSEFNIMMGGAIFDDQQQNFHPNRSLNRAESAVIVKRTLDNVLARYLLVH